MNLAQSTQVLVNELPMDLRLKVTSFLQCRELAAMGQGDVNSHRVCFPCQQLSKNYSRAVTANIQRLGGQVLLKVVRSVKILCLKKNISPESILVTSLALPLAAAATNSAELPRQHTTWVSIICTPETARLIRELLFEWGQVMIDLNRGLDHTMISCLDSTHTELYANRPFNDVGYNEELAIEQGNSLIWEDLRSRWAELGLDESSKIRYDDFLLHSHFINREGETFIELKITAPDDFPYRIFKQPRVISSHCYFSGEGTLRFSDLQSTCLRQISLVKDKMNVIIFLYTQKIIELSHNFAEYISRQEEDSVLIQDVISQSTRRPGGVFSSFFDSYDYMLDETFSWRVLVIVNYARKCMIYEALVEARQSAGTLYRTDPADFIETLNMDVAIRLHNNVISPTFFQFGKLQGNGFKIEGYDESMFCENNKEVMRCHRNL